MTASWPLVSLGECCEIVSGATPSTSDESLWGGDIHWATPKDLSDLDGMYISSTPRTLTSKGLRSCSATVLPPRSVLFSSRAPIGHVAINTSPMSTNQGFKSFVPSARVHAEYLAYWLRWNRAYLETLGNGATFKEVSKAVITRVELPLPPIEEQRRIAAVLDKADDLRTKRRDALAHLNSMMQATFDVLSSSDSSGRRLSLKEVSDIQVGYPFRSELFDRMGVGPPLCRGANVLPGRLDWSDVRHYPPDLSASFVAYALRAGDVVVAMDRPWINEGFKIAMVGRSDEGALLVQRVARVRVNDPALSAEFIYWLLRQPQFERHCRPTETTIPHISPNEIRNYEFQLPSAEAVAHFTAQVRLAEQVREEMLASQAGLDETFAALQDHAFSEVL